MPGPTWRMLLAGLLGLLVPAAGLVGYVGARAAWTGQGLELGPWLGPLAVAAAAGALAGLIAFGLGRFANHRLIGRVEALAAEMRKTPGRLPLTELGRDIVGSDLAGVWTQVEALAACYRSALAEVVQAQEQLEGLSGEGDHGPRRSVSPTHLVVGSSRHRMVARLAPNLNVISATPPLRRLLQRDDVGLLAHNFLELAHPEDAAPLRASLKEALRDGEVHNVTIRVLVPEDDGCSERFLQLDVLTCYDPDGAPQHLRCHFTDVTQRVLTERQLVRSTREVSEANARLRQSNQDLERLKESYRDLYHNAPVLYFSLDAAGSLVVFNETMVRTLGYPREWLAGRPYANLLTPAGRDALRADPGMMHRPGELVTQWVKHDGAVIDVWVGTTTIADEQGRFVRSRSAARDVSETRRLDQALRGTNDELIRANAQLRRTNQELEEFTYVVSHDLKEPLRTVEAFSNFLAQDYAALLGTDGLDHLEHIRQAVRRQGRLIDDLLMLSRTGRVIHTPRAFAWAPVVQTVLDDLHDLIGRKQAVVRIAGSLPAVVGDPERVGQLLANLIGNGLKYNPAERPEVVLGAVVGDGHDALVTLYVRDNGAGIDPAYHEQIFRIFRRLHRRDEVDGTGAGLAICKRIVEAHGGRIWVDSQPGHGATFFFQLPRPPAHGGPGGEGEAAGTGSVSDRVGIVPRPHPVADDTGSASLTATPSPPQSGGRGEEAAAPTAGA